MTLLVVSVATVLIVSALCSLAEAAVYAVRLPYIGTLVEAGSAAGRRLARFKNNMEQPISAILIVNTTAHTAGAAVAGAQAQQVFGEGSLFWFSAVFTLAVLFLTEIMPKVAGVAHNRAIARASSAPLDALIKVLYPAIWLTQRVSRLFQGDEPVRVAPEEEVLQFAAISAKEGSILKFESELVKNVLGLDTIPARNILTPRTVVFHLPADRTVRQVVREVAGVSHARIPVYAAGDPENWNGFVLRADVLAAVARDDSDVTLSELARTMHFVPEAMPCHLLLNEFVTRRVQILSVVDEYGAVVGIVTLEDVFEELLGQEILDETDREVDMQAVARRRARDAWRQRGRRGGKHRPGAGHRPA